MNKELNKTENLQQEKSGSLNPLFLYADGLRLRDIPKNEPLTSKDGANAEHCQEQCRCSEAQRHSLVKGCKSPTVEEKLELAQAKVKFQHESLLLKHCEPSPERAVIQEHEHPRQKVRHGTTGCQTVIEFRQWQDAWRIRTEVECTSGSLPIPDGPRKSIMLSSRGATKIAESCEFMHQKKGGFLTFVTGTFTPETRERIETGDTTIQKEVTRTMDALQKMYQRGWSKKNGERVSGHSEGLPYLWVVEVPENEHGEANPHIHMLLGWKVEYKHFSEWANRIESIWGNGYFHLEKIKDSGCAGAYMAKAAGYLCKAQDKPDQGLVQGNRYGISRTARAPGWIVVDRKQIHAMGQIIFDIYDHLSVKYGEQFRERKNLNRKLQSLPKTARATRKLIGERLVKVRKQINDIPIRCNRFQLVLKNKLAVGLFFGWVGERTGEVAAPEWLPDKPEGWEWDAGEKPNAKQTQFFSRFYERFRQRRFWRRLVPPDWCEYTHGFWHACKHDYRREQDYDNSPYEPSFEQLQEFGFV